MLLLNFYFLGGIYFDVIALLALYNGWAILTILAIHLFGSFCIIYGIHKQRRKFTQYNYAIVGMLFALVFFIPILGIFGATIITRWLRISQKNYRKQRIKNVEEDDKINIMRKRYAIGGLKYTLHAKEA